MSCRTERKPFAYATYHEFSLRPFSMNEASALLGVRLKNVALTEINVVQARSGGKAVRR